jgi:hypothetical protein
VDILPPGPLRDSLVAGLYANDIRAKRNLLEFLFNLSLKAREPYVQAKDAVERAKGGKEILDLIELYEKDANFHLLLGERETWKTQYEDTASGLVLMSAISLERLYNATGESLFSRGDKIYKEIYFSQAIWSLANCYKHLGELINRPGDKQKRDIEIAAALVDDKKRSDACAEFIARCGFTSYDEYERLLLKCGGGFETDEFAIERATSGIVKVALRDPHGRFRPPGGE